MALDTDVLTRDIKRAYQNRRNSSLPVRHEASLNSQSLIGVTKSTYKTLTFRENGNRLYKDKKLPAALIFYTMSVATALPNSEELRKAYGNRSAALFESKEYFACLLDVNRALKDCSDLRLKERLLDRKKRCLKEIESSTDVEIDEDVTNPETNREPTWRAEMLSKFGNPLLPKASPKIKLKYDTKWGRHFVATEDIQPGETLISEDYFIAMMAFSNDESRSTYCEFCTRVCHALIPCPSCALMMYCSEDCLTKAYNQYHRMECELIVSLPSFYSTSFDDSTPIRLFLAGTEQGAALENLMNDLSISDIFEENYNFAEKPFTGDYVTALRLIVGSFDPMSVKSRIEDAVEIVIQLRKFGFFDSVPEERLEDAEVFATALLLNNYKRRHINRLATVFEAETLDLRESGEGEGLVLLLYMMNHSCYPNVSNFRRNRENITFSVRPIKKDEQLFFSYHQDFAGCPKPQRVRYLDFVCQCEACTENWPPLSEFGISSKSLGQVVLNTIADGSLPRKQEHKPLFAEVLNVSAPLLNDTELKKLEIGEIIPIVVEILSVLYKLMKPTSYALMMFRYYVITFIEFFYEERKPDLSHNETLNFPFSEGLRDLNDLFTEPQHLLSIDQCHLKAMIRIYHVIARLNFYINKVRFVNKNFVG